MTTISTILKYQIADTALSVGDQPFKIKAKFNQINSWKYIDKLNKIKEFFWTVPNDEFTTANALLERKAFVNFIKPFRGIVCEKATNQSTIDLKACELAWHFTRRVFRQNSNARVSYGAPITHIQFEDDVLDKGVQSNDGTWTGTETYANGKISEAGVFNGSSRVNLANESNFDFEHTAKFSLCGFFKGTNTGVEFLFGKRLDFASGSIGYAVGLDTSSIPFFELSDGTTEFIVNATTTIRDDKYHHIFVTFSGNSNQSGMKIYVDGVLEGTGTTSAISSTILNALTYSIGGGNAGADDVTGDIDDIRIYNRELSADSVSQIFKTRSNPPENRELKTTIATNTIAQDILTHANTDMPSGLTWTLDPTFPTDEVIVEFNFDFNYDALQFLAENLGKDLFFDNERHIVQIATKGKALSNDEELDLIITSQPKISTDNFANDINVLGKSIATGEQLEERVTTTTVLGLNYEKIVSDNKISSQDQLKGVGNSLLDEFKKLTPSIKGEVPFSQFVRLNLESGDTIPISQPQKQLNGRFRIMDITVTEGKAKLSLESTETGIIRLRSQSLSDIIGGILDKIQDQSIET